MWIILPESSMRFCWTPYRSSLTQMISYRRSQDIWNSCQLFCKWWKMKLSWHTRFTGYSERKSSGNIWSELTGRSENRRKLIKHETVKNCPGPLGTPCDEKPNHWLFSWFILGILLEGITSVATVSNLSLQRAQRKQKPTFSRELFDIFWCPERDLNSHTVRQRLLRPSCLPFHHPGKNRISSYI